MPSFEPYGPGSGAIASCTRGMARGLLQLGYDVQVVTPSASEYYAEGQVINTKLIPLLTKLVGRLRLTGVGPVSRRGTFQSGHAPDISLVARILPALRSMTSSAAIVLHNDFHSPYIIRRIIGSRPPIVLWLHNMIESTDRGALADSAVLPYVFAVSDSLREWFVERYDLPADRIQVIHNGIDPEDFYPQSRISNDVNPLRVICHGRLDPNKGFHLVTEAISQLRREGIEVSLTIAGAPNPWASSVDEALAYRDLIVASLGSHGEYLGRVDPRDIGSLLARHHVACVVSLDREGFSLAALEGMAAGCAIVMSGRGGLSELGGGNCIVVAPEASAVAAALRSLAQDRASLAEARLASLARSRDFLWVEAARRLSRLVGISMAS